MDQIAPRFMGNREQFQYESLKLRLAGPLDAAALTQLRVEAYSSATRIRLENPRVMEWNHSDEKNLVLVIENDCGELVSTLKALRISDRETFICETNIVPPPELGFPLIYLKTGSTREDYRNLGLNTLLKIVIVRLCQGTPISALINTMNAGTSRIALLREMGFIFSAPDLGQRKNSPFRFVTPLLLGVLPASKFDFFLQESQPQMLAALQKIRQEDSHLLRARTMLV